MNALHESPAPVGQWTSGEEGLIAGLRALRARWRLIVGGTLLAAAVAAGVSMVLTPVFTARTLLLPPQQPQNLASLALGQLGALGSLATATGVAKSPSDQFIGLLQSATVTDRMIDTFKLMDRYDARYREDARLRLVQKTIVTVGRRDGLISIEVEDTDPKQAAAMANAYVAELRRLSGELALGEASQRRKFFEEQLRQTSAKLAEAQERLQKSGFTEGTLRAEPKASAEAYARLRAELQTSEARLKMLRVSRTESSPEVLQAQSIVSSLRQQLAALEGTASGPRTSYLDAYREFKYQETLFELLGRQFELARVDEAREGALIQVVDTAAPPERRSRPKRTVMVLMTAAVAFVVLVLYVLLRRSWSRSGGRDPL